MRQKPSKNNNQFKVDCDFPGLCALCHTEVAEFEGSHPNGIPKISRLKGNFHSFDVMLDDGSRMSVALCTDCFFDIKPEDMKTIMGNVIRGWDKEMNVVKWPEQKKDSYIDRYSERYITNRADESFSESEIKRIEKPDVKSLELLHGKLSRPVIVKPEPPKKEIK
jgi:hypothetical protein